MGRGMRLATRSGSGCRAASRFVVAVRIGLRRSRVGVLGCAACGTENLKRTLTRSTWCWVEYRWRGWRREGVPAFPCPMATGSPVPRGEGAKPDPCFPTTHAPPLPFLPPPPAA
eukprot:scaffold22489_cov79-Isochrysis_galbana.AAC.2